MKGSHFEQASGLDYQGLHQLSTLRLAAGQRKLGVGIDDSAHGAAETDGQQSACCRQPLPRWMREALSQAQAHLKPARHFLHLHEGILALLQSAAIEHRQGQVLPEGRDGFVDLADGALAEQRLVGVWAR